MATITKTIRSDGSGDYTLPTLWEADLDDSGIYTAGDDAVGQIDANEYFDNNITINGGGTINLNSIKLTVAEAYRHDGTRGSGAGFEEGVGGNILQVSTAVPTTMEWLEVTAISSAEPLRGIFTFSAGHTIANCIVYGFRRTATSGELRPIYAANNTTNIINCMSFDHQANGLTTDLFFGIEHVTSFGGTGNVLNCTVANLSSNSSNVSGFRFGRSVATVNAKNLIAVATSTTGSGKTASDFTYSGGGEVASNNASEDATADDEDPASNHLINITAADQFVSLTVGSEDLHLKSGADCIGAGVDLGTTPTGVNIDIDGRDRDAEGDTWDIGADQFVAAVASVYNSILFGTNF